MSGLLWLQPETVLDPRGRIAVPPVPLATRPRSLSGCRVRFYDNGKLAAEFGNYRAIADVLAGCLAARAPDVATEDVLCDLRVLDQRAIESLGPAAARDGVGAAVIALCDSGVTQPSVVLAAALERSGVPAVLVCLDAACELAAANALSLVPGLPLCTIAVSRSASREEVAEQAAAIAEDVVAGLTCPAELLLDDFQRRFNADGDLPADGGEIPCAEERLVVAGWDRDGRQVVSIEPGVFSETLFERLCERTMTDGLPVIPPTRRRVGRMLRFTDREPGEVIVAGLPPRGADVTVESLAVAAVMAGCRPEYFPIVVTACEAMADPRYRLFQAVITSHPGGNAVLVSGPLARELGIASGGGCLGPGFRANATIGRSLGLCLLNVGRALPGRSDMAVFGSPAEYSYCFAEACDQSPWTPLHTEVYGEETTTVSVHRCEAPHNVIDHLSRTPEGLLTTVASVAATLGGNNAYIPGELLVLLNPEHARIVADGGWSRQDVQIFLHEQARNPAAALEGRGITRRHPLGYRGSDRLPVVRGPEDVKVVVAGGAGPQSMVALPWGYARMVTRPVAFRDGRPVSSVGELA